MKRLAVLMTIVVAVVAAPPSDSFAQATTRADFVVQDSEGAPLADVQVTLDYKGHLVQKYKGRTNKKGRFTYLGVYAGPYTVTLTKEGYGEAVLDKFAIADRGEFEGPTELRLKRKAALPAPGQPVTAQAIEEARAALGQQIAEAVRLVKEGRFDEAEAAYQKLVLATPNFADVHYNLGFLYKRKNERDKAEACFRKAIECDPKLADGYNALAVLLVETGRADEALQVLEKGVAANDTDARLQFSLGTMYAARMERERARPVLLKVLQLDPANPEPHYQLASIAVSSNEIPEAVERLKLYVAAAPESAPNLATAKALLAALEKRRP